jgi:hypothetical protein
MYESNAGLEEFGTTRPEPGVSHRNEYASRGVILVQIPRLRQPPDYGINMNTITNAASRTLPLGGYAKRLAGDRDLADNDP